MEILQLRVVLDHDQQVFRDIEMEPGGTMDEIHEAILVAFQLDNDQMASFYESDEQWNKGAEIGLMDMGTSEEPIAIMSQTDIPDDLNQGDRYLYVYDFLNLKIFYVECMGKTSVVDGVDYPRIAMTFGEMPKSNDAHDLESLLAGIEEPSEMGATAEESADEEWDESDSFENLDDYEDFH